MGGTTVTVGAVAFLVLVWAAFKVGVILTLLIAIAANIVGFMAGLAGVAVEGIQAIGEVARALGS